jgi:putative redox protein
MPVTATRILNGLKFEIKSVQFTALTDAPAALGGEGSAPSPHEYLEISLAACTVLTLQMYAKRKDMKLEYADVKVQITAEGKSNEILREIALIGTLDETERAKLFEIAEKCPVHKILSAGAKITSRLV